MEKNNKIFLVDDDSFSLNLYTKILENLSFNNVATFTNGTLCLQKLNQKPKIIFLDYHMDDISGFEVLKKVKRFSPNIFIVMLSGQDNMKIAIDALKYGAFDYIIKGDNEADKIRKVLERIEAVEEQMKRENPSFLQKLLSFF
jgi:polysaccharide export outer membrane protein